MSLSKSTTPFSMKMDVEEQRTGQKEKTIKRVVWTSKDAPTTLKKKVILALWVARIPLTSEHTKHLTQIEITDIVSMYWNKITPARVNQILKEYLVNGYLEAAGSGKVQESRELTDLGAAEVKGLNVHDYVTAEMVEAWRQDALKPPERTVDW